MRHWRIAAAANLLECLLSSNPQRGYTGDSLPSSFGPGQGVMRPLMVESNFALVRVLSGNLTGKHVPGKAAHRARMTAYQLQGFHCRCVVMQVPQEFHHCFPISLSHVDLREPLARTLVAQDPAQA